MSLVVNTYPQNISNSGLFSVTTDLVKDDDHVNLRIRADITCGGIIIATVEKPKGLNTFDFFDILKPHVTGINFARNSGDLYKISGGSPLVAYTILFTEVYEDADGVIQKGDTDNASGTTYKFVPGVGDDKAFSNYVLSSYISLFANKTLRNNVVKFFPEYEYWLTFFTEIEHVQLFYSKDGGAFDSSITFDPKNYWGIIIINTDELMSGVTSNLRIQLGEVGAGKISEVITIYVDNTIINERVVLEYDGYVGGKEYLAFEGIKLQEFNSIRNYYTGAGRYRKPLSLHGINRQKLETRFKDINNAEYLESLLMSETVKKLEPSFADPTDVTIITDSVRIASSDMFTNEIDIEYSDKKYVLSSDKTIFDFLYSEYGSAFEQVANITGPSGFTIKKYDLDWCSVIKTAPYKISISPITENAGAERTGIANLSYPGASDINLNVTQSVVPVPDPPVATDATDITIAGFNANWDASLHSAGYYLDVSEVINFATFVPGYENLDVGDVLTKDVSELDIETDYYYRVRAYNFSGTSGNSNTIKVTTLPVEDELDIDLNTLIFNNTGATCNGRRIQVTSNSVWTVSKDRTWCTPYPDNGDGDGFVDVYVTPGTFDNCTLSFKIGGVIYEYCTVLRYVDCP